MNNENTNTELNVTDLDDVSGGGAAGMGEKTTTPGTIKAYCKGCRKNVTYLGQKFVNGGNTGVFKCTNTKCKEYGKIKYNDEVKW